jgi:hypothetical protein
MWFTCPKGKIENKLFSFIQAIQTRINQFLVLIGSNFCKINLMWISTGLMLN